MKSWISDILVVFPSEEKLCTTVRVLKTPKTESSVRKIFIPKSVAEMLKKLKASQEEMKSILGKDYQKYDLVIATDYGLPIGEAAIRKRFKKLIKDHDLPDVVFHSLRHTSVLPDPEAAVHAPFLQRDVNGGEDLIRNPSGPHEPVGKE